MMAPLPLKRSLADMQHTDRALPAEYNDSDYVREVLQLEGGQTEEAIDQQLVKEAEKLGITIAPPPTPKNDPHVSMCDSAITVGSHHARTGSTGSDRSHSTGMTSRSSNEHLDTSTLGRGSRRPNSRRSLSFSEYEKYLSQTEAQDAAKLGFSPPPMPSEPAPSLFSVSTRRSYVSIKNGIKNRFRFRRNRVALDEDFK
jgi:hypothetical protein